jgi:hypothetical protein
LVVTTLFAGSVNDDGAEYAKRDARKNRTVAE